MKKKPEEDPIVFPPLPPEEFARKMAKWEAREHRSKSKRTNSYGRVFARHEDARFAEVLTKRKRAKDAMVKEYASLLKPR